MAIAAFHAPRLMLVGGGAIAEAGTVLQRLGCERPLIVSDPYMQASGVLDRLLAILAKDRIGAGCFVETVPDPTSDIVEEGVGRLLAGRYDCLLALGGGSPMDTAKGIAILEAGGGHIRDYKVPQQADRARLPLVCIPTHLEQRWNARRVAELGLGIHLDWAALRRDPAVLRRAVATIRQTPEYAQRAAEWQKRIAEWKAPRLAADAIERLLRSRKSPPSRGEGVAPAAP